MESGSGTVAYAAGVEGARAAETAVHAYIDCEGVRSEDEKGDESAKDGGGHDWLVGGDEG